NTAAVADLGWGPVPTQFVSDYISINSASPGNLDTSLSGLRVGVTYTFSSNRGITLGSGGGTIDATATSVTATIASVISGSGPLDIPTGGGGTVILTAVNTYTGATSISKGTLTIPTGASLATSGI